MFQDLFGKPKFYKEKDWEAKAESNATMGVTYLKGIAKHPYQSGVKERELQIPIDVLQETVN